MKKHLLLILNIALVLFVSIFQDLYITENLLVYKSLASVGFVMLGGTNLVLAIKSKTANLKFCITMVVGLFFAMLGDILLEVEFIVGAAFFAVGHIIFFISYCFAERFKWTDLIACAVIAIPSVLIVLLLPIFNLPGMLKPLCAIYAFIISFMVGKAISNLIRTPNILNLIITIGSVLFFVSDLMLLLGNFGGINVGVLCLATYYPAECLLAISSIFTSQKVKSDQ